MKYANYNILQGYGINTTDIYQKNAHRPILYGISIDDNNALFYDDGIKLMKKGEFYILQISITDITECIPFESNLDIKARDILIDKDKTLLFPIIVKRECLSLRQNQVNLTLTLEVKVNSNLTILSRKIYESAFINKKAYSYKTFDEALLVKKTLRNPHVERLSKFAEKIFFKKTQTHEKLNADSIVKHIMIFANTQVTIFCKENNIPVIYENKDPLYDSKYTTNETAYTTFTSSMRKYNDIIVHSQIKQYLKNKKLTVQKDVDYKYSSNLLTDFVVKLNIFNCKQDNNSSIKEAVANFVYKKEKLEQRIIKTLNIEIENNRVEPFAIFYIIFSLHCDKELRDHLVKVLNKNIVNNWTIALFTFIKNHTILSISMGYKGKNNVSRYYKEKKSLLRNSIVILKVNDKTFDFIQKKKRNETLSSKAMERLLTKLYKYIHVNEINIFRDA